MTITIDITPDGNITGLYSDDVDLYAVGQVHSVRRASNVEFDEAKQIWQVINCADGQIVFEHKSRTRAIEWEIENFQPGGKHYDQEEKGKDIVFKGESGPCGLTAIRCERNIA